MPPVHAEEPSHPNLFETSSQSKKDRVIPNENAFPAARNMQKKMRNIILLVLLTTHSIRNGAWCPIHWFGMSPYKISKNVRKLA